MISEPDDPSCRPPGPPVVRIFISSPGDVGEEREKARRAILQLQQFYGDRVRLTPVLWEDMPLQPTQAFQQGIDAILNARPIDVAVFILWARLGSPLGNAVLSPNGDPYRSGTEREFELMLTAAETSGTGRPRILFYRRDDEAGFARLISALDDPAALEDAVRQRGLAIDFIRRQFHDDDGHNTRAFHGYRSPVEFAVRLKLHLRQLVDELLGDDGVGSAQRWTTEPYRGLDAFDLEHADIFFGREVEVCDLQSRLRRREEEGCAFVVVVGASGSGKSSLALAGLQSSLLHHDFDESIRQWRCAVVTPALTAGRPTSCLAEAVAGCLPEGRLPPAATSTGVASAARVAPAVAEALRRAGEAVGGRVKLLLVVDQFEELFTDAAIDAGERERFLLELESLARGGNCWVVATLRSDFYPTAQQSPTFLRLKGENGQFDLLPPDAEAVARIITGPARMAGLRFEQQPPERGGQGVVGRILADARGQADMLPLLSDLLLQLYRLRTADDMITLAAYESLGDESRTGLEGALSKRAEQAFAGLTPAQQATYPDILHALVTVEAGADVRRRADLAALRDTPERAALVDTLVRARLLTADGSTVCLAHEALLRTWDRVARWVADNRRFLRIRARVEQAATRWREAGRPLDLLLNPGLDLQEARGLVHDAPALLTGREYAPVREYVDLSTAHHLRRRRRASTIRNAVGACLVLLATGATAGAIYGWLQAARAIQQRDTAWLQEGLASMLRARVAEQRHHRYPDTLLHAARAIGFEGCGRPSEGDEPRRYIRESRDPGHFRVARDWIATRPAYVPVWSWAAPTGEPVRALTVDVASARLAVATRDRVTIVACGHPATETVVSGLADVRGMAIAPQGRLLAVATEFGTLVYDVVDGAVVGRGDDATHTVAWNPAGDGLAVGTRTGVIAMCDGSGRPREQVATDVPTDSLAFGPDGGFLAALVPGVGPRLFFPDHRAPAFAWARLVPGTADSFGRFEKEAFLERVREAVATTALAVSPDGATLAAGTRDGGLAVWSAERAEIVAAVAPAEQHAAAVTAVAFRPDGGQIASGSADTSVRLWEQRGADLHVVATLNGHAGDVVAVAYVADGRFLASAGADGIVRLWDVAGRPADGIDLYAYLTGGWYTLDDGAAPLGGTGFVNLAPGDLAHRWSVPEADSGTALEAAAARRQWRAVRLLESRGVVLPDSIRIGLSASLPPLRPDTGSAFVNGSGMELRWCPPGPFTMGSPEDEPGRFESEPRHEVVLPAGCWLGAREVTQAEWLDVMGENPATCRDDSAKPVESISWTEAREFCARLTDRERARGTLPPGWIYDLPAEDTWECACRAGATTAWSFGDDPDLLAAHGNFNDRSGNLNDNADLEHDDRFATTAPVGSYPANAWGFHDMHGNVWEWCRDRFVADPRGRPPAAAGADDPRVLRGGGWRNPAADCRSARRIGDVPSRRSSGLGLRVAMIPAEPDHPPAASAP